MLARLAALLLVAASLPACLEDETCTDTVHTCPPPASLTRVDVEPAGPHCKLGGTAEHQGYDLDGDHVLDDDEITATSFRCREPGALTADVAEPHGAHCAGGGTATLTGTDRDDDGVLDADEVTATRYACAHEVTGDVLLGSVEQVGSMREVTSIAGDLVLDSTAPLGDVELPALRVVTGRIRVSGLATRRLSLPALERAERIDVSASRSLIDLSLPVLRQCETLTADGTTTLTRIHAPALPRIGALALLDAPVETLTLGSLETAGTISIYGAVAERLDFPALTTVTSLDVTSGGVRSLAAPLLRSGAIKLAMDPDLRSVSLPALADAGTILVNATAVESLELPALRSATEVRISANPSLRSLRVPALARVETTFDLSVNRQLTSVGTLALTARRVGVSYNHLTALDGSALIAPSLTVREDGLTQLTLGGDTLVELDVASAHLTSLRLPAAVRADDVRIAAPALIALSAPTLTAVQTRLDIAAPTLARCQVDAVLARLDAPPQTVHLDLGTGTCP